MHVHLVGGEVDGFEVVRQPVQVLDAAVVAVDVLPDVFGVAPQLREHFGQRRVAHHERPLDGLMGEDVGTPGFDAGRDVPADDGVGGRGGNGDEVGVAVAFALAPLGFAAEDSQFARGGFCLLLDVLGDFHVPNGRLWRVKRQALVLQEGVPAQLTNADGAAFLGKAHGALKAFQLLGLLDELV